MPTRWDRRVVCFSFVIPSWNVARRELPPHFYDFHFVTFKKIGTFLPLFYVCISLVVLWHVGVFCQFAVTLLRIFFCLRERWKAFHISPRTRLANWLICIDVLNSRISPRSHSSLFWHFVRRFRYLNMTRKMRVALFFTVVSPKSTI